MGVQNTKKLTQIGLAIYQSSKSSSRFHYGADDGNFLHFKKEVMRKKCLQDVYFVMYDLKDNLLCFFDSFEELVSCTKIKIKTSQLNYYFNHNVGRDYVYLCINGTYFKLYKFNK